MTVLLIDGVGNVREWEITRLVDVLLAPVPVPVSARVDDQPLLRPYAPIAEFKLSAELSYPPVYRWVKIRS